MLVFMCGRACATHMRTSAVDNPYLIEGCHQCTQMCEASPLIDLYRPSLVVPNIHQLKLTEGWVLA